MEGDVATAEKVEAEGQVNVNFLAKIASNAPEESDSSSTTADQRGGAGLNNSNHVTHPVGRKRANAPGLYDMSGNVFERTCSVYSARYEGAGTRCASAPARQDRRVIRGGSYYGPAKHVRSAYRYGYESDNRNNIFGLRLALD